MVASSTSGLVDVDTTGPLLTITLGMINEDVFPDRGGTEDHHRLLGSNEAPTPLVVTEIGAVPGASGCVDTPRTCEEGRERGLTQKNLS